MAGPHLEGTMTGDDPNDEMRYLEALGEHAYTMMYDASSFTAAAGYYNDAKDAFARAIGRAREAGRTTDVERLEKRIEHIQQVFRSQFS